MNLLFLIIEFIVAIVLVLCYYKFIETRKIKKFSKNNLPVDLQLFMQTQNIDMKKISYKKLMKIVSWINAIDIAIVLLITNVTENILLKFVIAVPAIIIMIIISYRITGSILRKKGMTKDES